MQPHPSRPCGLEAGLLLCLPERCLFSGRKGKGRTLRLGIERNVRSPATLYLRDFYASFVLQHEHWGSPRRHASSLPMPLHFFACIPSYFVIQLLDQILFRHQPSSYSHHTMYRNRQTLVVLPGVYTLLISTFLFLYIIIYIHLHLSDIMHFSFYLRSLNLLTFGSSGKWKMSPKHSVSSSPGEMEESSARKMTVEGTFSHPRRSLLSTFTKRPPRGRTFRCSLSPLETW